MKTISSGKVSILDLSDNQTKSISLSEYNPNIHKKVLGGIVAEVNGIKQYVTKEEFNDNNLKGVHTGKVTVRVNGTDIIKHISTEEYKNNKITLFKTIENLDTHNYTVEEIKENGIVYTPKYIADYIVSILDIKEEETVLGPSVGHGGFIFSLIEQMKTKLNKEFFSF